MSERPPDDDNEDAGEDTEEHGPDESELPPPATWAGRRSQEDAGDEEPAGEEPADEEIGAGITDEFALDEEENAGSDPSPEEAPEPEEAQGSDPTDSSEEENAGSDPSPEEAPEPEEAQGSDPTDSSEEENAGSDPSPEEAPEPEEAQGSDPTESSEEENAGSDPSPEEAPEPEEAQGSDPTESSEETPEDTPPQDTAEAEPATVIAPSPGPKIAASAAEEDGKKPKPPRAGMWPRFIAASFIIIVSMATATAATFLLYLTDIAKGLGGLPGVDDVLETVDGGEPQTVLILGSDIRPEIEDKGRSDTTMLLRLDAEKNVLSLLSLPRDLRVNIPGYGIGKLNEAYTIGGPKLTTKVVSQLTGLPVNHVVNIDFAGFAEAVNAIECVFIDVDRDYFHSNEGLTGEALYSEIDIDAGYQQLCGFKALQYVRFRHDDNDLVRASRQQSFLREARQKVPPDRLFTKRKEFIDIFTKYTTSDVDDPIAMLDTLKLFVELRDAPIRRIEFQGDIGGPDSAYVTASNDQIEAAVKQFLGEKPAPTEQAAPSGDDEDEGGDGGGGDGGGGDSGGGGGDSGPPLIDASDAAERYALDFDGKLRFPVIAPVKLKPGSQYSEQSRAYEIDTYDGEHYPSYKLVFPLGGQFGVPEYYGVMGTKWSQPPILENPSETRQIGDRKYLLFYEGNQLQVVGFKTPQGSYWVSNTLTGALSEAEMLGVAESMKPFSPEQ